MNKYKFIDYIESIGFKNDRNGNLNNIYNYKDYDIIIYGIYYGLHYKNSYIGRICIIDLTPLKQISRKYKLKKILG